MAKSYPVDIQGIVFLADEDERKVILTFDFLAPVYAVRDTIVEFMADNGCMYGRDYTINSMNRPVRLIDNLRAVHLCFCDDESYVMFKMCAS